MKIILWVAVLIRNFSHEKVLGDAIRCYQIVVLISEKNSTELNIFLFGEDIMKAMGDCSVKVARNDHISKMSRDNG